MVSSQGHVRVEGGLVVVGCPGLFLPHEGQVVLAEKELGGEGHRIVCCMKSRGSCDTLKTLLGQRRGRQCLAWFFVS